jgi:hypothetical protein
MKAMLLAFVAMAVIAVGANYGLTHYAGFSAADRTTVGESVRLD